MTWLLQNWKIFLMLLFIILNLFLTYPEESYLASHHFIDTAMRTPYLAFNASCLAVTHYYVTSEFVPGTTLCSWSLQGYMKHLEPPKSVCLDEMIIKECSPIYIPLLTYCSINVRSETSPSMWNQTVFIQIFENVTVLRLAIIDLFQYVIVFLKVFYILSIIIYIIFVSTG
jgi:hypothetical protein